MPVSTDFKTAFETYLNAASNAAKNNQHHDYRRQVFLSFLERGYKIKSEEIDVEQFIKIDVRRRGWIDALFGDVLFEFKRNLEIERPEGLRELHDYLNSLKHGRDSIGILTDGLTFEVYRPQPENNKLKLEQTDTLNLANADDPETVFLWLDSYLFSQKGIPPTSKDIVQRFGALSPTFQSASQALEDLLTREQDNRALQVKLQQWRSVLAKVYGSDIGSSELFIRHTYLSQFAKLLAYCALHGIPREDALLENIINGSAFHTLGVNNVGEIDFFSWILSENIWHDAAPILRKLAQSMAVYDLSKINEDLFKQLYQNLVDPQTRHDLGEYYTPDWLAELTLKEINYHPGQSLLDPSCGSGTFLFSALRRLAEQGLQGWELVNFALQNVAGMDVHPLAVTIARINYLLAILPHMKGKRAGGQTGLLPLPIYMADALQTPEDIGTYKDTLILPVDRPNDEKFFIPMVAAQSQATFNEVIDRMDDYARYPKEELNLGLSKDFVELVSRRFSTVRAGYLEDMTPQYWIQNLRLLNKLIHEGRNSIWAYILKNTARPLLLTAQKFDVIAGNPPWLVYRSIKDRTYQSEVKTLIQRYGLLESGDVKLFTQMELATLFMVHCEKNYLKDGGIMAMVMPRSTITGAKQHRNFQARGLTRVLDLLGVFPLFNVPTAVLIRQTANLRTDEVPSTAYHARLPAHEMTLIEAAPYLTFSHTTTRLLGKVTIASPYYYERFKNGAILTPRNLCFVRPRQTLQPGDSAFNPSMQTDPDVNTESKVPWKGIRLEGLVYPENLFATLLSKNLVPFGYRKLHLVALPVQIVRSSIGKLNETEREIEIKPMGERDFLRAGHLDSWKSWFLPAEKKWDELKKETSTLEDLIDQYDYQRKLTSQQPGGVYKVLYTSSGVHLASCVMDTTVGTPYMVSDAPALKVYEYPVQGFFHDATTYCFDTLNQDEAHYLCAILNSPFVDKAIKDFQPRGKGEVGQRHIQRIPFETCAIPQFDPDSKDHQCLAKLSQEAHQIMAQIQFEGQVVKARRTARAAVETIIQQIDDIAKSLLGLS